MIAVTGAAVFALIWNAIVWTREELQRRRAVSDDARASLKRGSAARPGFVRSVGLPGVAFSLVAACGIPITIVGAVAHLAAVVVVGLVLLVAELIDMAVIWPQRQARHRGSGGPSRP